jgi:hypothetical protein
MENITLKKKFVLGRNFTNKSFQIVGNVLEKHSGENLKMSRGLYSEGPTFKYGTVFNGGLYAELNYSNLNLEGSVHISLFGKDEDELNLVKEDIEKNLEELLD